VWLLQRLNALNRTSSHTVNSSMHWPIQDFVKGQNLSLLSSLPFPPFLLLSYPSYFFLLFLPRGLGQSLNERWSGENPRKKNTFNPQLVGFRCVSATDLSLSSLHFREQLFVSAEGTHSRRPPTASLQPTSASCIPRVINITRVAVRAS